jgi:cysteine synthase A
MNPKSLVPVSKRKGEAPFMNIKKSVLGAVGRTPLIKLNGVAEGVEAEIALKAEFLNPSGSVKDRIGLAMVEAAEADGHLTAGTRIIEPTSGNTGVALALTCAAKGLHLTLVMPETVEKERQTFLTSLGAELVLTPALEGMRGAIARAEELSASDPTTWCPRQFSNPENPRAHRKTTGQEIWEDTNGSADIFVCAVGTGGTLTGVADLWKGRKENFRAIAVEPSESPVISQTLRGERPRPKPHRILGIGPGFIPENLDLSLMDEVLTVSYEDSVQMVRRLALEEGLFVGTSTGANVWAAIQVASREENRGKLIVTVGCSSGEWHRNCDLITESLFAIPT